VTELSLAPTETHIAPIRPVTRPDGCTLYQSRDGKPAAVWLPEGAHPEPGRFRALYAADWPEGSRTDG
jgi:hypothetical protein